MYHLKITFRLNTDKTSDYQARYDALKEAILAVAAFPPSEDTTSCIRIQTAVDPMKAARSFSVPLHPVYDSLIVEVEEDETLLVFGDVKALLLELNTGKLVVKIA